MSSNTMDLLTQLIASRQANKALETENQLLRSLLERMIARCAALEQRMCEQAVAIEQVIGKIDESLKEVER